MFLVIPEFEKKAPQIIPLGGIFLFWKGEGKLINQGGCQK
jgi:hypothetical protein